MNDTQKKQSPLFVRFSNTIETCLTHMVKRNTSCAVIVDDEAEEIRGIVTERDILRKLACLDLQNPTTYKINTIMSTPVRCVRRSHLLSDLRDLHFNHGHRHFVVTHEATKNPSRDDVIGLISTRHIFELFLKSENLGSHLLDQKLVEWFHASQN